MKQFDKKKFRNSFYHHRQEEQMNALKSEYMDWIISFPLDFDEWFMCIKNENPIQFLKYIFHL